MDFLTVKYLLFSNIQHQEYSYHQLSVLSFSDMFTSKNYQYICKCNFSFSSLCLIKNGMALYLYMLSNLPGLQSHMSSNLPGFQPYMLSNLPGLQPHMSSNLPGLQSYTFSNLPGLDSLLNNLPGPTVFDILVLFVILRRLFYLF